MSAHRWIFILISSLCLALASLAWLSRPTFCLDSKLVEKIDSISGETQLRLPSCRVLRSGVSYHPDLEELRQLILPRLQRLERETQLFKFKANPVRMSIIDTQDVIIRVHPKHIIMSKTALLQSQVLEKALLLSFFSQTVDQTPSRLSANQILNFELISDLWLATSKGQLNLSEPYSNQILNWNTRYMMWPLVLRGSDTYCDDPWQSYFVGLKCDTKSITNESFVLSLRPLLGQYLRKKSQQLSIENQINLIQLLIQNNREFLITSDEFFSNQTNLASQEAKVAALKFANAWIERFDKHFLEKVSHEAQDHLNSQHWIQEKPLQFDLIVMVQDEDKENNQNLWLQNLNEMALANPLKKILFINKNEARLLPDLRPFRKDWLPEIRANQSLLIQCQTPQSEQLSSLSDRISKLLFIRNCQNDSRYNFFGLIDGDIEQFALENPQMNFVQIHLPSLRFALSRKNLNPIFLLQEQVWNSPFFHEIGWRKPIWDKYLQAYRTQSEVEVIEMYRDTNHETSHTTSPDS